MPERSTGVDRRERRRHAVIAGTGRAGTTFLVRFLQECGLDGPAEERSVDDRARAGLEHHLLDDNAPYVVKDPWLFAYCDAIDPESVTIDALVVPVRELMAAASSRILQERIAMAEGPFGGWPTSDVHGVVPGGAVYSLDPVDEARILAVGFHRLIHWATVRQLPLYLVEFPRAVNDRDYLLNTLWPWLGRHCDRDTAIAAFAAVADPELLRIDPPGRAGPITTSGIHDPSTLDRDAMAILLKERSAEHATAVDQLAEIREVLAYTEHELAQVRAAMVSRQEELAESRASVAERDNRLADAYRQLERSDRELGRLSAELERIRAQLEVESAELEAVWQTASWRMTGPLRGLKARLSGVRRRAERRTKPAAGDQTRGVADL